MTPTVPHKSLKLIAGGKLSLVERVAVHRGVRRPARAENDLQDLTKERERAKRVRG